MTFWYHLLKNQPIENPYQAAMRFLNANDLPQSYLDQVVQFIEKNTAGVALGGGQNDYVDPFTGTPLASLLFSRLLQTYDATLYRLPCP
jgi:hypothetical protein